MDDTKKLLHLRACKLLSQTRCAYRVQHAVDVQEDDHRKAVRLAKRSGSDPSGVTPQVPGILGGELQSAVATDARRARC